ncbi:glutaredoxin family protein [Chitinilyticum litopenaei]|uniref:glutaredoxin family protein n=1 Tax=Chitinilyticum litopenaei TaxID=1121276 RepID=UPI0003F816D4|nr:glutaredoxin family protein [Chitinilyticum litopenaei]
MRQPFLPAALLAIACLPLPATAAVYQWRDANGQVHYTDKPPPVDTVRQRKIRDNIVETASRPQNASAPSTTGKVTLWIAPGCGQPCEEALALLDRRKVIYDVKNITSSEKLTIEFFAVTGSMQSRPPVLQIGGNVVQNWDPLIWSAALSSAGYR